MGTLGNGDGNWPRDGDGAPDGLPDLPPGWGPVVIPDDPSELADEAARVRAELRHAARRRRWRRRLPWLSATAGGSRLPAVVLALAIAATLASLFTLSYTGAQRGAQQRADEAATPPTTAPSAVPALDLLGPDGRAVAVRSELPAVILLTEGCRCSEIISATAAAVPPEVSVLVVARAAPPLPDDLPATGPVLALADPAGGLRAEFGLPAADEHAAALLVTASAGVVRMVPRATGVDDFRAALPRLATAPAGR